MDGLLVSGDGNISIVVNGTQFYVAKGAENYDAVFEAIKNKASDEDLINILNPTKKVQDYLFDSEIKIEDGEVLYKGKAIHNTLTNRIIAFMNEGLPVEPLFNFLKKLMANPSFSARNELFDFLNHKSLPITEDGDFLAYKAVTHDYKDKWTGTVDNSVGQKLCMERYDVDDDRNHVCSSGYHAGTLSYVFEQYGRFNDSDTSDKCVIVKISPTNVVSVPSDCICQKLRICTYEVVRDYEGEMVKPLYKNTGESYSTDADDESTDADDEHIDDYEDIEDIC